ncbi:MAG: CaiB/BaiF CoA-transferase family protein [Pseudomonadota bacterium]
MTEIDERAPPLKGLRVLELARVLAGPWAGQILADLGADVLKVEGKTGDDTREWGPPFLENSNGSKDAAYFHACNRGKRSIIVDLSNKEGQACVKNLAREADVIIENFKVGGLKRFGLDYANIKSINPSIIYCSITGFGQDGPYNSRGGYDFIIQAMSGVMDITGTPGGPPQKMGVAFSDIFTGLYTVIAIQSALLKREKTGLGDYIDMALFDCTLGVLANQAMNYLSSDVSPKRLGNAHPNIAPYEAFATKDGWIVITVGNNGQFARLCEVLGLGDLQEDVAYATNSARVKNKEILSRIIAGAVKNWSRTDLLLLLEKANVPAGPVNSIAEAFSDPQSIARGMQKNLIRKSDGKNIPSVRIPIKFLGTDLLDQRPSPELGADEAKWLSE